MKLPKDFRIAGLTTSQQTHLQSIAKQSKEIEDMQASKTVTIEHELGSLSFNGNGLPISVKVHKESLSSEEVQKLFEESLIELYHVLIQVRKECTEKLLPIIR